MEQVNRDTQVVSTVHYADGGGWHQWSTNTLQTSPQELQGWNTFQLVWNCTGLGFYMNGQQVHEVLKTGLPDIVWPFDKPFFLIINTAVGGALTGNTLPDTSAAAPLLVDYVRVYGLKGR